MGNSVRSYFNVTDVMTSASAAVTRVTIIVTIIITFFCAAKHFPKKHPK